MPRRSRRSREERTIEALLPLIGLFAFAWVFLPQIRVVIVTMGIVVVVGLVIAVVFLVIRKQRRGNSTDTVTNRSHPALGPDLRFTSPLRLPRAPMPPPNPDKITSELLAALEWRRFEILVTLFFQKTGYDASRGGVGADGGVDIIVRHAGHPDPAGYVQCKAWHVYTVGVKPIRELYGVMMADKVPHAFFVTTGSFTSEAMLFAQGKPLVLISGADLLKDLNNLPEATRREILTEITSGDYTTPTCPRCDIKMVERQGPNGNFWGCSHYPRCRQTFKIKESEI